QHRRGAEPGSFLENYPAASAPTDAFRGSAQHDQCLQSLHARLFDYRWWAAGQHSDRRFLHLPERVQVSKVGLCLGVVVPGAAAGAGLHLCPVPAAAQQRRVLRAGVTMAIDPALKSAPAAETRLAEQGHSRLNWQGGLQIGVRYILLSAAAIFF